MVRAAQAQAHKRNGGGARNVAPPPIYFNCLTLLVQLQR